MHAPLKVGDEVRTCEKSKAFTKGHEPKWSRDTHKVVYIKDGQYLLDNQHIRRRAYLRHELLKVA